MRAVGHIFRCSFLTLDPFELCVQVSHVLQQLWVCLTVLTARFSRACPAVSRLLTIVTVGPPVVVGVTLNTFERRHLEHQRLHLFANRSKLFILLRAELFHYRFLKPHSLRRGGLSTLLLHSGHCCAVAFCLRAPRLRPERIASNLTGTWSIGCWVLVAFALLPALVEFLHLLGTLLQACVQLLHTHLHPGIVIVFGVGLQCHLRAAGELEPPVHFRTNRPHCSHLQRSISHISRCPQRCRRFAQDLLPRRNLQLLCHRSASKPNGTNEPHGGGPRVQHVRAFKTKAQIRP
mmetsp:Transcript_6262/g.15012  ORF Transcript_6262/g.15012 Transcript_6262/m.15012 type:complete len:291 (+) Transcript_6262:196-1068(+)